MIAIFTITFLGSFLFAKGKLTLSGRVVDSDGKKVKKVMFGDPNMEIRKDNPEARKSFRARHKCDTATDKTSARYWSCKMW